jgi:predicted nucleic acid-binding protein
MYLLDTSVINRLNVEIVAEALATLAVSGDLLTTSISQLEIMAGSRSPNWSRLPPRIGLETGDDLKAIKLCEELHLKNRQRGRKPGDLLIAAIAIRTGFTVIHYDHDFDAIAELKAATLLKTAWVVPAGSIS